MFHRRIQTIAFGVALLIAALFAGQRADAWRAYGGFGMPPLTPYGYATAYGSAYPGAPYYPGYGPPYYHGSGPPYYPGYGPPYVGGYVARPYNFNSYYNGYVAAPYYYPRSYYTNYDYW